MITIQNLDEFLNSLFGDTLAKTRTFDPELGNGKQLELRGDIKKISVGVTLTEDFITESLRGGADTLVVHHGLKISAPHQIFLPFHTKRLDPLFRHHVNVYGFHGALDMHQVIGNNAVIARELGGTLVEPYFDQFGWVVDLPSPRNQQELAKQLSDLTNHDVFSIFSQKETVKR